MADDSHWPLKRLLFLALIVCSGALLVGGRWYYVRQRESLHSSTFAELGAIADFKAKQIGNWRSERLGDGSVLSSRLIADRAERTLSGTDTPRETGELREILQRFTAAFHYAGAAVVDSNGLLRLEVTPEDNRRGAYPSNSTSAGAVALSELYVDSRTASPWMALLIPVPRGGKMILDIDPATFLYPYVQSWPRASLTGETVLVRREGNDLVYVSEGRFAQQGTLWKHRPWPDLQGDSPATGLLTEWVDYRGEAVLAVARQVPGSDWFVIAKMDLSEVNAPLRSLSWEVALGLLLLSGIYAVAAGLIWRTQQLHTYRAREAWFRQITNETRHTCG